MPINHIPSTHCHQFNTNAFQYHSFKYIVVTIISSSLYTVNMHLPCYSFLLIQSRLAAFRVWIWLSDTHVGYSGRSLCREEATPLDPTWLPVPLNQTLQDPCPNPKSLCWWNRWDTSKTGQGRGRNQRGGVCSLTGLLGLFPRFNPAGTV